MNLRIDVAPQKPALINRPSHEYGFSVLATHLSLEMDLDAEKLKGEEIAVKESGDEASTKSESLEGIDLFTLHEQRAGRLVLDPAYVSSSSSSFIHPEFYS